MKDFDLGTVLSITHDYLLAPNGIDGVYEILNYMTNSSLWTHQLPSAARKCAPVIFGQHPWLRGVKVEGIDKDNWLARLADLKAAHGETVALEPLPPDDHLTTNPFRDLPKGVPVIPVIVDGETPA